MSVECQVNVKSQSELDIGGRETCYFCNSRFTNVQSELMYPKAMLSPQAGLSTSENN